MDPVAFDPVAFEANWQAFLAEVRAADAAAKSKTVGGKQAQCLTWRRRHRWLPCRF
ncbi:MAG: hypothetical protein AB7K09_16325 [Planctomycetota bacterium]